MAECVSAFPFSTLTTSKCGLLLHRSKLSLFSLQPFMRTLRHPPCCRRGDRLKIVGPLFLLTSFGFVSVASTPLHLLCSLSLCRIFSCSSSPSSSSEPKYNLNAQCCLNSGQKHGFEAMAVASEPPWLTKIRFLGSAHPDKTYCGSGFRPTPWPSPATDDPHAIPISAFPTSAWHDASVSGFLLQTRQ